MMVYAATSLIVYVAGMGNALANDGLSSKINAYDESHSPNGHSYRALFVFSADVTFFLPLIGVPTSLPAVVDLGALGDRTGLFAEEDR
jgi:hypothetical protein